jgi:hypothetical protein
MHRYANMQSTENKARTEQITTIHELKRMPCKESIAMVNPAFTKTKQEVGTSNLNVRQRKPLPPKQIQTLIHHGNKELLAKQRKIVSKMLVFDINWKI